MTHAWRDVSFYQPPPGLGHGPAQGADEARHRACEHARAPRGTPHNFADAEADLIDLYWDIEMARDGSRQVGQHAASISRQVGGVMGTRVLRWQQDTASRRSHAAELRRERLRVLEERVRFGEAMRWAERRDRRAR